MAVESRDPQLTLHRHLKITQRVTDISLDLAPIKLRIVVDEIGRAGIAELLVDAGFGEFVVERVEFARVERIAQLADQITGPDQARVGIGGGVVLVFRDRKARQFDGGCNTLLIDERNGRKAIPDKYLPPLDVIG